jgi:uroporphyrinogen III methyltransferase/synthase
LRPAGRRAGKVYLVGAGPGDPALITVRGLQLLSRADVVIHDALVSPALLRAARQDAERIDAGKKPGERCPTQSAINQLMVSRARRGRRVVRLKGGDPCLFGRAGEEAEALVRAGVAFEVVPGVTAALGAAAAAGIPLTHRRLASSVVLATGHEDPGKPAGSIDWKALAGADTLVLYMGVKRLEGAVSRLVAAGMDPGAPAALVRWATRPDQQVIAGPLKSIPGRARKAGIGPPAVLIVGRVVRLRRRLDWAGRRPLSGRTIVVTRAKEQSRPFSELLEEAGARVLEAPAIRLAPPPSWAPLDAALRRLEIYRIIIFTSPNGVERFFARLAGRGIDVRDLKGIEFVAIGPATAAAITARGIRVAAVPEEYRAEGLLKTLRSVEGARILIPRAAVARDILPRILRKRGARVDVVPVYRTLPAREGMREVSAALRAGEVDLITFTSSSTVARFIDRFRGPGERARIRAVPVAAIGPITARSARGRGLRVAVMPRESTIPALAAAIVRRLRNSPSGTPRGS